MNDSAQVIQLLSEIKNNLAGISGFRYSSIVVAAIVALSALFGGLMQAWIQNVISKREFRKEYAKLVIEFRSDTLKEGMNSIRVAAAELFAEFDVVYNMISDQDWKQVDATEINKLFFEISKKTNKIGLHINLQESSHKAVFDSIKELYTISQEYAAVYQVKNISELGNGYKKEFERLGKKYGAERNNGLIDAIEKAYTEKQDEILLSLNSILNESWQQLEKDNSAFRLT